MIIDYISTLRNMEVKCEDFKRSIIHIYFNKGQQTQFTGYSLTQIRVYRECFQPIKACVELCRLLNMRLTKLEHDFYSCASSLDSSLEINSLEEFKFTVEGVRLGFLELKPQISAFYSAFDDEERERINEAIHDYFEGCYYSCVAMSVSAAESRLLKLMCIASPESEKELDKKTLGQLMKEYIGNKSQYSNVVPERHEPLLNLCNTYRTFSVHPKRQKVTGKIASSIFNLAIEFLIDSETRPEAIKTQLSATDTGE